MNNETIAIIGAGNMGCSLIGGLLAQGTPPQQIVATNNTLSEVQKIESRFGIKAYTENQQAVEQASVIIFTLKPNLMLAVITELAASLSDRLIISVAAGMTINSIENCLSFKAPIVRCMPNTPAMIASGATGLFANNNVNDSQKKLAENILNAVGITAWVNDEKMIDVITALSGSGPAYFFYVMEALERAAINLGLDANLAHEFTIQTAIGAGKLAANTSEDLATLRSQVTSPGGTTASAIAVFDQMHLDDIIQSAVQSACDRAAFIAKQHGK